MMWEVIAYAALLLAGVSLVALMVVMRAYDGLRVQLDGYERRALRNAEGRFLP